MNQNNSIVIVGAGLVGSLLALLLAKQGYPVAVYERRPDPRQHGFTGGRSINLALSDRGWRALALAGVAEQVKAFALPMHGRLLHDVTGAITFQPYGKTDQAIYSVSRGGLNHLLVTEAEATGLVRFHFGHQCRNIVPETGEARFAVDEGQELTVQADVIFGTDGAFSAVRNSLMRRPRFNYSQQYLDYGYKEINIPPNAAGQHSLPANGLHIWPRGNFMLIALPNPDGSFTSTLFLPYEGPDSFAHLHTDQAITAFFTKYFPDILPHTPDLIAEFHQNPTAHLVTVNCDPWQVADKVLLLGDAAHAIVPFYGQGMNAGFEDCTLLLAMVAIYDGDWSRILAAFSAQRVADGQAIAQLALRNFVEMRDWVADPKFLLRKAIAAHLHERYPADFLPLYSMVTFSHMPYSEAWAEAQAQDQLFEQILALPDIEHNWQDNPALTAIFQAWLQQKAPTQLVE